MSSEQPFPEEKFLPIDTLREYHIRKKDVDTLEKADIWDSLLVGNKENNKERLKGIGFPDDVAVKISNAIEEIMDKLTTRVNNFFQRIEPHFKERLEGSSDEEMRAVILASRECFEKCLSFSEMHEYLGARFSQMKPQATIKVYEFYTGMKGGNSYKQLSVVRASQRKEKKRLTQASVQDDQKTPESVQDDQKTPESVQDDQPTQQSVQDDQPTQESVQDDLQDDQPTRAVDSEQPEQPEEKIFPIDTLLRYGVRKKDVTKLQEAGIWDSLLVGVGNNKALLSGMGFSDEKAVKICDAIDRIRTNQAKPQDLSQILSQLFSSQTRMDEAISSQREMVDTLMGLQMETATKEELSSVQRDLFGKLQTVGTAISVQVATNIQASLTSGSDKAINIFEKVVISKLKKAINKLQTSVQESIKISDSAKTSQKSPSMDGTEEMAVLLGEGDYERCFTMALQIHDDASLYWLLSKVQPNQLLESESFQLSQQTLWALLERLLDCGFFCFTTETLLTFAWFKAVTKAIITDPNISGDARKVLAKAVRVVQDKILLYVNSGLLVDDTLAEEIRFFKLKTGAMIPSVGLGTWQADPGLVGNAVEAAIKIGYRHIDCAQIYGNEKEIGLVLKKLFDDGVVKREEIFITSKLWCTYHGPQDVPDALNRTLQDLQLDYVDLYLIHWPVSQGSTGFKPENILPTDIPSTWKAMEALFDAGKARAIGVSNFSTKDLADLLEVARVPPAVNQVECHPSWQQTMLRDFCKSKGVHLSGYSPLGSPGTTWLKSDVLKSPILGSVAEKLGKTPAQVALRWGLQMGQSVLPKSTHEFRIKQNFDVFSWSIPDDMLSKFSEIEQGRLVRGMSFVHETSPYKTLEQL